MWRTSLRYWDWFSQSLFSESLSPPPVFPPDRGSVRVGCVPLGLSFGLLHCSVYRLRQPTWAASEVVVVRWSTDHALLTVSAVQRIRLAVVPPQNRNTSTIHPNRITRLRRISGLVPIVTENCHLLIWRVMCRCFS